MDEIERLSADERRELFSLLNAPRIGRYWGPVKALVYFQILTILVSALISAAAMLPLYLVIPNLISNLLISIPLALGLAIVTYESIWKNCETREVPNAAVAVLELFGNPLPIYLETGNYKIPFNWGKILTTNRDMVLGPVRNTVEENSANPGLIYVGSVFVTLDDENDDGKKMVAAALDNANVGVLPSFRYLCVDPGKRLKQNNPIKDLNQACRDAIRDIIKGLTTAPQTNFVQDGIKSLIGGARAYFVRTRRSDPGQGVHGGDMVIHNATQKPMIWVFPSKSDMDKIKASVLVDVIKYGYPPMLDAACSKPIGAAQPDLDTIEVMSLYVGENLRNAFSENGYTLDALPRIGDIDPPVPVSDASAKAAAEVPERAAELADAETSRQRAAILGRDGDLDQQTAALAALAKENSGIKIVHIPGAPTGGLLINTN